MEVALAAVPIFFSACQGFVVLLDKIKLLRHYKKEMRWLNLKVDVQLRNFRREIHRLVIDTLDTDTAQSLISDNNNHDDWKIKDVEGTFKRYLGGLFPDFLVAVQEVHQSMAHIQTKLAVFAPPPDRDSRLFEDTRNRFRIAFKKDEYKEDIASLKEWIAELKNIRKFAADMAKKSEKQVDESQETSHMPVADDSAHYAVVRQYRDVRRLSSGLQTFLQEEWSCRHSSHTHHSARIFLNCPSQKQTTVVWSLESNGRYRYTAKISNHLLFKVCRQELALLTPESEPKSFEGLEGPRSPKRRRMSPQAMPSSPVSLLAAPAIQPVTPTTPSQAAMPTEITVSSLCEQLETTHLTRQPHQRTLSRVDKRSRAFYKFEPLQTQPVITGSPNIGKLKTALTPDINPVSEWDLHKMKSRPLSELLSVRDPHSIMLDRELVQILIVLVRGKLMNYSTPAWPSHDHQHQHPSSSDGCLLDGVSFLSEGGLDSNLDIQRVLETIHIPVSVGSPAATSSDTHMTDTGDVSRNTETTPEDYKLTYGIRNLDLWRLGVTFISFALWKPINWQDVESVRRKARALDWYGAEYRAVVMKLIDCDFGVGTADLGNATLQAEIVRTVVEPLERIAGIGRRGGGVEGPGIRLSTENLNSHGVLTGGMVVQEPERWMGTEFDEPLVESPT